jgi:hypothetical protein
MAAMGARPAQASIGRLILCAGREEIESSLRQVANALCAQEQEVSS